MAPTPGISSLPSCHWLQGWHICWVAKTYVNNPVKLRCFTPYFDVFHKVGRSVGLRKNSLNRRPKNGGICCFKQNIWGPISTLIGPHSRYIHLSSLLQLAPTPGIYSLPSCNWLPLQIYTLFPPAIGSHSRYIMRTYVPLARRPSRHSRRPHRRPPPLQVPFGVRSCGELWIRRGRHGHMSVSEN